MIEWRLYVEKRLHKKARLKEAASQWRQQLLRSACGQWLATADSLSHMRSVMAARHQASSAFESFHLVQRCALHWKVWARRRAAARDHQVRRDKGLILTSTVRLDANPSVFPVTHQTYPSTLPHVSIPRMPQAKPLATLSPARPRHTEPIGRYVSHFCNMRPFQLQNRITNVFAQLLFRHKQHIFILKYALLNLGGVGYGQFWGFDFFTPSYSLFIFYLEIQYHHVIRPIHILFGLLFQGTSQPSHWAV